MCSHIVDWLVVTSPAQWNTLLSRDLFSQYGQSVKCISFLVEASFSVTEAEGFLCPQLIDELFI